MSSPLPQLQALRIPSGWSIPFNDWWEVDPDEAIFEFLSEDLLQLENAQYDLLIDVGWYGEISDGSSGAVIFRGDFNGLLLAEAKSRDRLEIVEVVEKWLQEHHQ